MGFAQKAYIQIERNDGTFRYLSCYLKDWLEFLEYKIEPLAEINRPICASYWFLGSQFTPLKRLPTRNFRPKKQGGFTPRDSRQTLLFQCGELIEAKDLHRAETQLNAFFCV